jgi:hypothetical protein
LRERGKQKSHRELESGLKVGSWGLRSERQPKDMGDPSKNAMLTYFHNLVLHLKDGSGQGALASVIQAVWISTMLDEQLH